MNSLSDDDLRWLLALLEEEKLAEIEVHEADFQVLVRAADISIAPPASGCTDRSSSSELTINQIPVLSPVAGVFYRISSPQAQPFVQVGDYVEHGDTVGLVEAMKLFNEVPSPASGRVVRILVENEVQIEEDQPLMIIEKPSEDED